MEKVLDLIGKGGIGELLEANPSAPIFFFTSTGSAFLRAQDAREAARGLEDIHITPITRGSMDSFVAEVVLEDAALVDLGNVDSEGDPEDTSEETPEGDPEGDPEQNKESNPEGVKPKAKTAKSSQEANPK